MECDHSGILTVTANRRAVLEGCDGMVDYDEEAMVLRAGRLQIRVNGRGLKIKRLTGTLAVIEGMIESIEYTY